MAGIQSHIFVPDSASAGKLAQIEMYGAKLVRVPGTREETAKAALDAAQRIFYASHNRSPYFLAGLKTVAYEIAEQLDWKIPDWVVAPVGGGNLIVGIYHGFRELLTQGAIEAIPKLIGVQAANCAPVYHAWCSGANDVVTVAKKETAAEGIAIALPVRGKEILEAIRGSAGFVVTVEEEAIWSTIRTLGCQGIYVEPTACATVAALPDILKRGFVRPEDRIVFVLTGSGLKATDKILQHFQ
jgi:threonine synthase